MYRVFEFDLARNALKYAVVKFDIKKMHIPYYLCDVIRHTLISAGCKPKFYHIDDNFFPAYEFSKNDYILYPNYWGVCAKNVEELVKTYPNLIVDNAHAYYDEPNGFVCFNAGHKFGFKESYLWLKEDILSQGGRDVFTISKYDGAEERRKIFLALHRKYKNINKLSLDLNSTPFCYPCLTSSIQEADNLVKNLKEEGKTVYRYWSPLPESFLEYKFYSRLVPIPILPDSSD